MAMVPLALRRSPAEVLALVAGEPGAVLLDVPDPARPVTLVACRPTHELRLPDGAADPLGAAMRFAAEAAPADAGAPFPACGGVIGYLAYEAGRETAPRARRHPTRLPLVVMRRYDPLLVLDRTSGQWHLAASAPAARRARWLERLAEPPRPWRETLGAGPLAPAWTAAEHAAGVRRILAYLAAGDAYQVNLTQAFSAPLGAPAWTLYERLADTHPVPYGGYLDCGDFQIVANSPELLLRRRGRLLETRPVKGTRARGADPASDAAAAEELLACPKERAEHVMIVDLERNDLGRVCEPGSIAVEPLLAVERHPSVHHLVSSVRGRVAAGVDAAAVLRAVFPGGSITGAPKVRAMEIIAELEDRARGVYTGALGLFGRDGDCELALPIRTAVVERGRVTYHAGGGIVADSDPERELAECWLKTAALRTALGLAPHSRCSSG